jgi:plastocyanin
MHILAKLGIAAALALALSACDDDSPTSPDGGGGNDGTIAATITIDATGMVTPKEVTIPAGSRVTFTNNHTVNHEMNSDPHPAHSLCPSLNAVGFLAPGQSRTSSNLNTVMVCTYHDHLSNDTDPNLRGTIRIQ